MQSSLKPIYLFADSQLLFWKKDDRLFLDSIKRNLTSNAVPAAYLGASNGDNLDYYEFFKSAMLGVGIDNCRMIPTDVSSEDARFLQESEIILLAGGDVERGWNAFSKSGVYEIIVKRYVAGATLIGVSAGAVQLGWYGWPESRPDRLFETFKLVPFIVGVHDEKEEWIALKRAVQTQPLRLTGIGIPAGGGLIYDSQAIRPVRHPLFELVRDESEVHTKMLLPETEDWAR